MMLLPSILSQYNSYESPDNDQPTDKHEGRQTRGLSADSLLNLADRLTVVKRKSPAPHSLK